MSINEIIVSYIVVKAEREAAEKREKALKELILEHARGAEVFETEDYTVIIKTSQSVRLDTVALYKDFPDIKETYGRTSVSRSVIPVAKPDTDAADDKRTA